MLLTKITEGINEAELPIQPGTRVLYNGTTYEAISQNTGKQGWEWRVVSGRNTSKGDRFFFQYDHPIYKNPRDNSRVFTRVAPTVQQQTRQVILPPGVETPQDAFFYAMKLDKRTPELEYLIAKDPEAAARYAMRFKFDFVLAEPNIESHPYAAMLYAINVKNRRYNQQIEDVIKTDRRAWSRYSAYFSIL